ncbi:hypothetical protein [Stieleria neptunia]|uniref:hypothetical protein n=1 Tax=Stieleria neptunia TaxID=2527979 RepID=UPI0011A28377|nr:hypothetical protein [Stieleria neptunia]
MTAALKHFAWQDTGENLQVYVRRLRKKCPFFWRMWFWWLGPLCGAVVVAIAMHGVGPMIPVKNKLPSGAWAAIGAFFGLFWSHLGLRRASLESNSIANLNRLIPQAAHPTGKRTRESS